MLSKGVRRPIVFLVFVMLCFAPLAQAGTHGAMKAPAKVATVRHQGALQAFWRGLVQILEKNGVSIDPSGSSGSGIGTNVPGTDDEGASIDPWGVTHG